MSLVRCRGSTEHAGGRKTCYWSAIHSVTANIGHVHVYFISFFEGLVFSCWLVTNVTSARGTLHCRKTRILCGDQLVICGLYTFFYLLYACYITSLSYPPWCEHIDIIWLRVQPIWNAEARGKVLCFCRRSNPCRPVCSQILYYNVWDTPPPDLMRK
jgi:hypothetical protein